MMFLKCEGFDYDFDVVIFSKDIDTYKDKLEILRIIVVNGFLDINFEFKRKSVKSQKIDIYTIS
ncbi:MAG: hypothetical protein LBU14_00845 [Candidatus Peribacteria bacterium]|jgi:hypothetical protein|nr:hypothetical protein [Candidatus Peribacteria bacterium]